MWAAILAALTSLFNAIPVISKWFTKTATEKSEKAKLKERENAEHFKKTGRPKW